MTPGDIRIPRAMPLGIRYRAAVKLAVQKHRPDATVIGSGYLAADMLADPEIGPLFDPRHTGRTLLLRTISWALKHYAAEKCGPSCDTRGFVLGPGIFGPFSSLEQIELWHLGWEGGGPAGPVDHQDVVAARLYLEAGNSIPTIARYQRRDPEEVAGRLRTLLRHDSTY